MRFGVREVKQLDGVYMTLARNPHTRLLGDENTCEFPLLCINLIDCELNITWKEYRDLRLDSIPKHYGPDATVGT
jgi:hypothetical protein